MKLSEQPIRFQFHDKLQILLAFALILAWASLLANAGWSQDIEILSQDGTPSEQSTADDADSERKLDQQRLEALLKSVTAAENSLPHVGDSKDLFKDLERRGFLDFYAYVIWKAKLLAYPDESYYKLAGPLIDDQSQPLVDKINAAVRAIDPDKPGAQHLALALARVGNRESVPALIDLYDRAVKERETLQVPIGESPRPGVPGVDQELVQRNEIRERTACWCVEALWDLSGRKFLQPPEKWALWWVKVEPYFEVARGRKADRPLPDNLADLLQQLKKNPPSAREQLLAIGPAAIPELLAFSKEAEGEPLYAACQMLNQLTALEQLSTDIRRNYLVKQFVWKSGREPLEEELLVTAYLQISLADWCHVSIELGEQASTTVWKRIDQSLYQLKYYEEPIPNFPYRIKREDKLKRTEAAMTVIIGGLRDERLNARKEAAHLAFRFQSKESKYNGEMVELLKKTWPAETDRSLQQQLSWLLCRCDYEEAQRLFLAGIHLEDEALVIDSLYSLSLKKLNEDQTSAALRRIEELTFADSDQLRYSAVSALVRWDHKWAIGQRERLGKDSYARIRGELCTAIGKGKNPMHGQLLVDFLEDEHRDVRLDALHALADPAFAAVITDLTPLLNDEINNIREAARETIVAAGGEAAIPVLIEGLRSREFRNVIYEESDDIMRALRDLTDQRFQLKAEWLAWWNQNSKRDKNQ